MTNASVPTPRSRRITCLGFDWRAEVSLKETLALLRGKTQDHWQYSDELTADVIVYETRNTLAQALVRRCQGDGAPRVFFPSSSEDEQELTLRYPFGASRLIGCLDHASRQLAGAGATYSEADDSGLCQRLDEALRTPGAVAVALRAGDQTGWIRLPEQQLHWSQPLGLDEMAGLLAGEVSVQALGLADTASLRRLAASCTHVVPAETLLWSVGITRSRGHLLSRLDATHAYRLRRWPNFGVIGRRALDLRCCSLLMQRPLTPTHLSLLAGIPLGVIGGFLNACALAGLLEESAAPVAELPPAPATTAAATDSGLGGMLRRIRLAFAITE